MNHSELIDKLTDVQAELWQSVTDQIAGAMVEPIVLTTPLVVETVASGLQEEFSAPAILIEFAFSGQNESLQQIVLPLETATALYQVWASGEGQLDENTVGSLTPALETIVQGLCLGIGNVRNEVVVASDVSIRLGIFDRPKTVRSTDPLIRVQVGIAIDVPIGSLAWIVDPATAHFITGLVQPSHSAGASFPPMPAFGSSREIVEESNGLEILMDVPLDISVELGRTRMVVKDIVDLGVGSIVEIEKAAGEPVDILVNGRIVARGEVVVIEDNFGVRITEILNPRERLARLKEAA